MNREIKFRAWHKTEEMFVDAKVFDFNVGLVGTSAYDNKDGRTKYGDIMQNFIVEQYTGLKDKNGVEIYEGDIISYHRHRYEIVYSYGCLGLEMEDEDYGGSKLVPLSEIHQMIINEEVIGNIHENADLLK